MNEILKQLKRNTLIRCQIEENYENYQKHGVFIAMFHKYDENKNTIDIGHPLSVINGECDCGGMYTTLEHIPNIFPLEKGDYEKWKKAYQQFHNEIIEEKGYDFCEEVTDEYINFFM